MFVVGMLCYRVFGRLYKSGRRRERERREGMKQGIKERKRESSEKNEKIIPKAQINKKENTPIYLFRSYIRIHS